MINNFRLLPLLMLSVVGVASCNRETFIPEIERPHRTETNEDRLKDSVYIYTHGFYLWQDDLPDWFADVRGNTGRYNSADAVLEALKGYAVDDRGDILDRFSFLDRWGTVNAEIQQGLVGSFGFDVRFNNDTELYVKKVDIGSPAYREGIRRGWQILQINGNSDLSLASLEQDNFAFLFDALDARSIDLMFRKPDGVAVAVRLSRGSYQLYPILASNMFSVGGKPVGYFAFDSFISTLDNRGNPTDVKTELDRLMDGFEEAGVQEMIVDLRYNGGGAVITAEYLSDLLAPLSANTRLMYTNRSNEGLSDFLLSKGSYIDLAPVYFNKTKGLDLHRIYFLVTEATASASELLINNLKPYMEVKLIGEDKTYGKPVGFFDWDILGVDLYAVSFQTFNAVGEGDYFSGMPVDKVVYDDLTNDFGNPEEALIAEALYYARNGIFSIDSQRLGARADMIKSRLLDNVGDKGMYYFHKNRAKF